MLDNSINTLLTGGTGDAIINIYTGTPPADCEAVVTETLLGTCVMAATPFGAATNLSPGAQIQRTASISDDTSADTTGIAGHFRVYSSNSSTDASKVTCYIQGSAGEAGDSTDLTLDDKNIVVGGTISITDYTITMPEA